MDNPTLGELLNLYDDDFDESLVEGKRDHSDLAKELQEIQAEYNKSGPSNFYTVTFDEFINKYPAFNKKVFKPFLLKYVEITPEEMQDPEILAAWQDGDLILPEDWPALFDFAEKLIAGQAHQFKDLYPKNVNNFEPVDDIENEPLTDSLKESANGSVEKFKKLIKKEGEALASKKAKGNPNFEKALKELDKKEESLKEDFNMVTLTPADQASNIRSLIKTCWDNVDAYSMYAQQLNEFGSQQALEVVNTLINDLYIAIGSFEDALGEVDLKSAAIDTPAQVQAVVQVAPQVLTQPMVAPVMLEKFTLDEGQPLNENVEDSSDDLKKEIEDKEIQKANKEVEKYRKEKVEDSLNPDTEEVIEETSQIDEELGDDDSFNPKFYESLLKLED